MKKNIIFINALSAKLGGGRTYLINLLSYHTDSNVLIYVACPDKSMLPDSDNIRYVETPLANRNILFRAFWELIILPRLLLKLNIDTLFVPGGMDFTLSNIKYAKVTMFRNMLPFDSLALSSIKDKRLIIKNRILKMLMIRTMNSADHVIFISNYAKKSVSKYLSLKGGSTIYHGIAPNFMPNNKNDCSQLIPQCDYILYVSRFEQYKNHLNVIKAYNKLSSSLKAKYRLIIVGEKMEPSYSECVDYIKLNKLDSYVEIKGKVPYQSLPTLYQNAYISVFASSCENCPNILLEAIGCGAAVITSKTEPMPEFAKDAALYFDELNPESIHQKLEYVLNCENKVKKMREKSIALRGEYMWKNTASLTWQCLNTTGEKNV
ncbi:glycosyltransferase family 4 protein [Moritella viscosa]|uniref:glycosyltransferase family 4 protein n=1 Tax=Moritella viscosa TaxID=80854 RepID=UPI000916200A|nr:glycosyltransferase family 1 protein [Moritella viscosa]SGY94167.1 Glycosyl transferase group 1 [Moritella viscosa]